MTLQLLHSEFPYIWWKFDFIFYQCMSCLCSWRCWSIPWRNKIKSQSSNVVGYLNSCLPLFWDRSLPASWLPASTIAGFPWIFHRRPYSDLASQSIWSSFTVQPFQQNFANWRWVDESALMAVLSPKLSHPHISLSLLFLYLSIFLLEVSGNGHFRHIFLY